jgi:hypothetical protein
MSIFIQIHAVHTRRQLGSLDEKKQEVVFFFSRSTGQNARVPRVANARCRESQIYVNQLIDQGMYLYMHACE